jgi:hypothetical protein
MEVQHTKIYVLYDFVYWQYLSQWGLSKGQLLLIENPNLYDTEKTVLQGKCIQ